MLATIVFVVVMTLGVGLAVGSAIYGVLVTLLWIIRCAVGKGQPDAEAGIEPTRRFSGA